MKRLFSTIKAWTLYMPVIVFFLVLPFVWNTNLLDASLLSRQLFLSFFLVAMLATFVFMFFKGLRFRFGGKREKVVLCGLSLFMLMHVISSLFGVDNGYEALFRTVKEFGFCLFFFFIYQLLIYDCRGRELLLKLMLWVGAFFISLGIIQLLGADFSKYMAATKNRSYYLNLVMEQIYSTCSNKNLFSSLLFITLPISVYFVMVPNGKNKIATILWRIFAALVTVVDLAFILVLLTRTVWLAVFMSVAASYVLICVWKLHIVPRRLGVKAAIKAKLIYIGVPLLLVVSMAVVFVVSDTQIERTIVERVVITFNPEKYGYRDNEHGESSVAMRKLIWEKSVEMIKDHPLLGAGPGQWQIEVPKYGVDEFDAKLREGTLTFQRPHNDFLWFASEVGLLGLLGFVVSLIGIICAGLSNIRHSDDKKVVLFNILAVSALWGWIVISLLDYPHERIEHNVFFLTISAIMLADWQKHRVTDERSGNVMVTISMLAAGLVVSGLHLWQSWAFFKGEKNARNVLAAYYDENWDAILVLTRNADKQMYTLDNFTVPTHYYKGVALSYKDNDEGAIREFNKAIENHPNHMLTYCAMGTSYMKLDKYDEAVKCFERVFEMSPRNNQALYDMAVIHYNKKQFKQALEYILKLPNKLELTPNNFESVRRTICKAAVNEDASRYNRKNLMDWINDDNKVDSSIKRYYSDSCAFDELILKELGPNNQ